MEPPAFRSLFVVASWTTIAAVLFLTVWSVLPVWKDYGIRHVLAAESDPPHWWPESWKQEYDLRLALYLEDHGVHVWVAPGRNSCAYLAGGSDVETSQMVEYLVASGIEPGARVRHGLGAVYVRTTEFFKAKRMLSGVYADKVVSLR